MEEKNLLLIDDEEMILTNLKYLLKNKAHHIFTATRAMEGYKILNSEKIHCVVCDISMPEMTGVELIRRIREEGNEVPFIFYTAFGNHVLMQEAAKYGAFDFLTKPVFEDLESIVSRGLGEGFKRANGYQQNTVSEYQKILDDFLKENGDKDNDNDK